MAVPTIQGPGNRTFRLGCVLPTLAFDYGPFRVQDYANGKRSVTLRLGAYFDAARVTAPPPGSTNYRAKAAASLEREYLNDQYGDCVIASKYHMVGLWTGNDAGAPVLGTDQEVLSQYHGICGPGDNGCIITDVMDVMKSKGLPFNGVYHKIDDYVSVDWTNKTLVQVAIYLFACGALGIDLPSAWTSGGDGSVWDVTNSGSVGGHDVPTLDYDEHGVYIATWGGVRLITWPAFTSKRWIGEFDVALSPDWYGNDELAPNGINAQKLRDDLAMLKNGQIPPIDVPPPPLVDWFW